MKTFEQYNEENPTIYTFFEKFTLEAIRKGFKNYGAKSIFELIRWHTKIEKSTDDFKINNSYAPGYARLFMKKHPQHEGFFFTRQIKSKKYVGN